MPLCECGCGLPTKSENARFITGHHQRLKGKNPTNDYTGYNCIKCNITLNSETHSSVSKLSTTAKSYRRAYRICRNCLSTYRSKTRNREKSRAYSRKFAYEKWEHTLANQCRRRSRDYGLTNEITFLMIKKIFQRQKGKCYWFGIDMIPSREKKALNQPSVDRLDPNKGYTESNCILCCYFANIGRRNTEKELWDKCVEKMKLAIKDKYVSS